MTLDQLLRHISLTDAAQVFLQWSDGPAEIVTTVKGEVADRRQTDNGALDALFSELRAAAAPANGDPMRGGRIDSPRGYATDHTIRTLHYVVHGSGRDLVVILRPVYAGPHSPRPH